MELLVTTLGMPPGSEWAHIWCVDKVADRQPATLYFQRASLPDHAARFSLDAEKAAPMAGFTFDLFGRMVDEMTPHCWQINPPGGRSGPLTVEIWRLEVPIGPGLLALRSYEPATGAARRSVEIIGDEWEQDVAKVKRGFKALFMTVTGAGGRPRTPKDAKVDALAQAGLRWLKAHPHAQVEDFGRAEMGEATSRGEAAINKHMGRNPSIVNDDVHRRMHDLLAEEKSPR